MGLGWSTPRPGRFIPGKDPVPIVRVEEVGWAQGPTWTGTENFDPRNVQVVASRYIRPLSPALPDRTTQVNNKHTEKVCSCKAWATLETGCPQTVLSQEHGLWC
jgi:hypothetical protein